ncbi:LOB domain-containing protein 31 [Cardamine amara subsp. amara]|uniref:LOB domain-containing protein 31 n=1 Tax=Cardamine amara subsp. amara TaxID=228776 RepID=A0ABD1B521_CARAN
MSTGGGSPCGACKLLRRKCVAECVFAPYFGSEEGTAHFAAVHKGSRSRLRMRWSHLSPSRPGDESTGGVSLRPNSSLNPTTPISPQNNSPTEAVIASSNAQLIASTDDNKNVPSSLLHTHCMPQQQLDESEDMEISTESVDFTRLSKLLGLVDPVNEEGDLNLSQGNCRPSSPI